MYKIIMSGIKKFFSTPCPWCKEPIVYFKIAKPSRLFGEGFTVCPYCKKVSIIANIWKAGVVTLLSVFIFGSIIKKTGLHEFPFIFFDYNFTQDQKVSILCLIYWPIPYLVFHKTIRLVKYPGK